MIWVRCWDKIIRENAEMHIGPGEKPGPMFCGEDMRDKPHLWTTTGQRFESAHQLQKKSRNHAGSRTFFVFSELFFFLLEEQRKEGSKKRIPPQCGEELRKRPFRPLCGPGRRVRTPAGGWTRRREQSPQNRKFSTCSKRVSIFDIFCVEPGATMKMAKANTIAFR